MKKQIIALVLIVLMALTVLSAVTVTTAKQVDAAPPKYYIIAINENGKWTQCNLHETLWVPNKGSLSHYEWSRGNAAFVYAASNIRAAAGDGDATLGVKLRLNTGELTWEDVQEMPLVVKVTIGYNLMALQATHQPSSMSQAGVGVIRAWQPSFANVNSYTGPVIATKTATFTVETWEIHDLRVSDFFHKDPELGIVGGIPIHIAGVLVANGMPTMYSASLTVYNIELQWVPMNT